MTLGARPLPLLLLLLSSLASSAWADDVDEALRYRALTESLARGDFVAARDIASGLTGDSHFARKARTLEAMAAFLGGEGSPPGSPPGVGQSQIGGMRIALSQDGAFNAALFPESGVGGYRPLLFGWPAPFSSRVSLLVDGEPRMLSPQGGPSLHGSGGAWVTRELGIEVRLALRGEAPPGAAEDLERRAKLRIEVTAVNRSDRARRVGVRLLLDLVEGFDDAPDVRLGSRRVLGTMTEFSGEGVPVALSIGRRAIVLRGLGRPVERAVLTSLDRALSSPFDFAVTAGEPLGPDSALALTLEPATLPPGGSRTLTVELVGEEPGRDVTPPIVTQVVVEPDGEESRRVVLMMENDASGATGPLEDLRVTLRPSPGLAIVSTSEDLGRLGTLALGERIQRSVVVRSDSSSAGPLRLAFDIRRGPIESPVARSVEVALPAMSATFIEGRVRDVQGRAVSGADVTLVRDGRPVGQTVTRADGRYRFDRVAVAPHHVFARRVVHREPAAKAAHEDVDNLLYDIVLSSQTIDNAGNPVLPQVRPGRDRDVVLAHSLTRYSVLVVVEWDARREYLEQIVRGMRKAAEFLYVASDGQLTFGRVAVHDAGRDWNSADLWDWANNSVHPNASVAGIRHRYHPVQAPWNTSMNFGRQWAGAWDQHGLYSTVVHEFGHYGLGLYDEYLGSPQGAYRGLAYWEMCRCIMGHQYSDHKICWDDNHRAYTNQGMWNGRACWRQIQQNHQGMRSGLFIPVTTPIERGGVVPPDFVGSLGRHSLRVGEELKAVIRDADTSGFDAGLSVAGPFGTALPGVLVYAELRAEGRTTYQGTTWGNGRMQLMGVHGGDRITGLYQGARAELVLDERRDAYVLEFGSEPGSKLGPPPLVRVRPERAQGRPAGASVEILPLGRPDGDLSLVLDGPPHVPIGLDRFAIDGRDRWVGTIGQNRVSSGRVRLQLVVPDAVRGDATIISDVVMHVIPAAEDADIASFDGSLHARFSPGAVTEATPFAVTSTSGPAIVLEDSVSVGRVHAVLPGTDLEKFAGPVVLVFHLDLEHSPELEPRRYDEKTDTFVPLRLAGIDREGEVLAEIEGPGTFALFERK